MTAKALFVNVIFTHVGSRELSFQVIGVPSLVDVGVFQQFVSSKRGVNNSGLGFDSNILCPEYAFLNFLSVLVCHLIYPFWESGLCYLVLDDVGVDLLYQCAVWRVLPVLFLIRPLSLSGHFGVPRKITAFDAANPLVEADGFFGPFSQHCDRPLATALIVEQLGYSSLQFGLRRLVMRESPVRG